MMRRMHAAENGAAWIPMLLVAALSLLSSASWSQQSTSPAARRALAARIKRDSTRCEAHGDVDTCNDAIRWNPSDPALLMALGDALVRAKRPADALRDYHRAAALAPKMPGLAAKISAADKRLAAVHSAPPARHPAAPSPPATAARAPSNHENARTAAATAAAKRFTNVGPETQSH